MVSSSAKTVAGYLRELPAERRAAVSAVREVVNANLPAGYEETMLFGMISWVVPLARYPETYNGKPLMYASLGAQKNYTSLYLSGIYGDPETRDWFERTWRKTGKPLDVGKSCVRFRKLDDLPLDLVGQAVARMPVDDFIGIYEEARTQARSA